MVGEDVWFECLNRTLSGLWGLSEKAIELMTMSLRHNKGHVGDLHGSTKSWTGT